MRGLGTEIRHQKNEAMAKAEIGRKFYNNVLLRHTVLQFIKCSESVLVILTKYTYIQFYS